MKQTFDKAQGKRIFSGIQPSGDLHIGNYLGAIKNWVEFQDTHENIFCVVDLHAITVPQDAKLLRKRIREIANIYLASGIDPKKSTVFVQSDRPEHSELAWILNCFTYMGELERMIQFKVKSSRRHILKKKVKGKEIGRKILTQEEYGEYLRDKTGVGLFDYPVLMAADILLYDTHLVPVGKDQYQHLELTRTIAKRFNNKYRDTFTIPKPYSTKEGLLIMGLDDSNKKMAKSANSENNYIALRDPDDVVRKKIARAVTDSGSEIKHNIDKKPAITNLLNIMSSFSEIPVKELEKKYKGKTYKEFKDDLAEVIIEFLKPFQKKLSDLEKDPSYTEKVLKEGAEKLAPLAQEKLQKVKKAVGLGL